MSRVSAPVSRRPSRLERRARGRARAVRRALAAIAALVGLVALATLLGRAQLDRAVEELRLPLRHEDIIRQQAAAKRLDPALIAAVIYQESRFRDRTSPAGAKGLMQITPSTARYIGAKTGGTRFELRDLGTPQINIQYGTWYLRHLIDRYRGDQTLAIAAYNAGGRNVDEWVARAGGPEAFDASEDIRFGETRAYVSGVRERREMYRERYPDELGL